MGNNKPAADTSKPVSISLDATKNKTDSNVLIVVNERIIGTIREIKKLDSLFAVQNIDRVNVLKDSLALSKYGENGKYGVIEIYLKNETASIKEVRMEEVKPNYDVIFDKPEIEAAFPGGDAMWRRYLERTLNAQIPSDKKAPMGSIQSSYNIKLIKKETSVISQHLPIMDMAWNRKLSGLLRKARNGNRLYKTGEQLLPSGSSQ